MHAAALAAQTHRLDRQVLQRPREGTIKERIHTQLAAFYRAMRAVPTPSQMQHVRPGRTCEAALVVDELAGEHRHQHDSDKVSRARGQTCNQVVDGTGRQVDWRGSQVARCFGKLRHLPSIAKLDCFCYSIGKTRIKVLFC
jgi:hypothetical protein